MGSRSGNSYPESSMILGEGLADVGSRHLLEGGMRVDGWAGGRCAGRLPGAWSPMHDGNMVTPGNSKRAGAPVPYSSVWPRGKYASLLSSSVVKALRVCWKR